MDTRLIAKILSTEMDGSRAIGTGYPIAENIVLTARHVVVFPNRNKNLPIIIEWPDYNYKDENVTEIVFDGGDKYDLVILRCKTPPLAQLPLSILTQRFPVEHETWAGFGYPRIGRVEAGTREKISVLGKFHPTNSEGIEVNLTSESDSLEKEGWCGLSGAPVFQGKILYAVIISTPRNRDECFSAVSIPWLLKTNSNFKKATGYLYDAYFANFIAHWTKWSTDRLDRDSGDFLGIELIPSPIESMWESFIHFSWRKELGNKFDRYKELIQKPDFRNLNKSIPNILGSYEDVRRNLKEWHKLTKSSLNELEKNIAESIGNEIRENIHELRLMLKSIEEKTCFRRFWCAQYSYTIALSIPPYKPSSHGLRTIQTTGRGEA